MIFPSTTVVILSKGNEKEVRQLLLYLNQVCPEDHFVLADGDEKKDLEYFVKDLQFKNLTYFHSPDVNLYNFYSKIKKALEYVSTDYVMLADTDDFILPNGLKRLENFLDENIDFISVGTQISGFKVTNNKPNYFEFFTSNERHFSEEDSATDRIINNGMESVTYYNLFRLNSLKNMVNFLVSINPSSLVAFEQILNLGGLIEGKQTKIRSGSHYLRQADTSQYGGGGFSGFPAHMVDGNYTDAVHSIRNYIQKIENKSIDHQKVDNYLRDYFINFITNRYRNTIIRNFLGFFGLGKVDKKFFVKTLSKARFSKSKRLNQLEIEDINNFDSFIRRMG